MDDDFKEEVFEYLDELRKTGVTNMFGAGSYIRETFGTTCKESSELLTEWMRTFSERHAEKEQG